MSERQFSIRPLAVLLLLAAVAGFIWLGTMRNSLVNVIGDLAGTNMPITIKKEK